MCRLKPKFKLLLLALLLLCHLEQLQNAAKLHSQSQPMCFYLPSFFHLVRMRKSSYVTVRKITLLLFFPLFQWPSRVSSRVLYWRHPAQPKIKSPFSKVRILFNFHVAILSIFSFLSFMKNKQQYFVTQQMSCTVYNNLGNQ